VKLLLDVHNSKAAMAALQQRCPGLDVAHIADWQGGTYRAAEDGAALAACFDDDRVFVTYDQRTVPGLLRIWAAEERPHAGVFFGDNNTVPAGHAGAVAKSLAFLAEEIAGLETTNVVRFLRPGR